MAQTRWTRPLVNFFKKKTGDLSPEPHLEFSRKCLEEVRTMTSPGESKSSEVINYEQCIYLVARLDTAVRKASSRETTLEHLKILCLLAKKVKCFIEGCCNGHWLQAAVTLTNSSDCIASLGFDLKLFAVLHPPYSDSRRYSSFPLTIGEVSDLRDIEGELVKEMASNDEDKVVTKLRALIRFGQTGQASNVDLELAIRIQYGQASNDDLELATFLLERLDRFKQSFPSISPGSLGPILHERDLTNLKHMVQIGRGGYGTVHKASWLGIDVAVKTFYGTDNPVFKKEMPILSGLSHPNIVSFLCHGKDMGECFIVMELMDRDLFLLLKERLQSDRTRSSPFSVFEEFDVILQIAEAMDYLHEMRVLHRDLKSHNILVRCMKSPNAEGYEYVQVKVSDFGLSRTKEFSMTQTHLTPNMGTTKWMAPELMKYWNTNNTRDIEMAKNGELMSNYPYKCDVYSFGMVCLEILTGDVPFPNMTANEVKTAICAGERPKLPNRCHKHLRALIEKCWNAEASSRPCFSDICTELRDLKSLHMMPTGFPTLQYLQKRKRKVETDSSGLFLDLSLGPSLRHVSTSGNVLSPRPVSNLRQNSFSSAFNPNLGDNSTTGRPTPASESQMSWLTTEFGRTFTIAELQSLTSNFAEVSILGRGDCSVVYEGLLADFGKVAVKRMMGAVTRQGFDIIQVRVAGWVSLGNQHLVGMLGDCIDGNDLLLVNEYMSQGTLTQRLFKYPNMDPAKSLSWTRRLRIAMDVAQALEYLHRSDLVYFHPFLKSSNVLLDDDFNAKVSGFGLLKPSAECSLPQGAGYKAPEYSWDGAWTKAVHVYSFGVVLMELLTGRPAVDLVRWFTEEVWTKLESVDLQAALDPHLFLSLKSHSDESMMVESILVVAKLAMDCTAVDPMARPSMEHVVSVLRCLLNEGDRSERTGLRRVSE